MNDDDIEFPDIEETTRRAMPEPEAAIAVLERSDR